jgi:crotonobetainyl-CoA hydratase
VNEVVPPGELMEATRRWVDQILACAPLSIRASKDVVSRRLDIASLGESMEIRYESIGTMVASGDFVEGPKAFAEKRAPNWTGR